MQNLQLGFWNEDVWMLGSNLNMTWSELQRRQDVFPHLSELSWTLPVAMVTCFVRFILDNVISSRAARYFNVQVSSARNLNENDVLESAFRQSARLPDHHAVLSLAKRVDMSPRQVERWWRRKMASQKPSVIRKFNESMFRCVVYFLLFFYGFYTLTSKPWFLDTNHCWYDWPVQPIDNDMAVYYGMELAFYISLLFSIVYDTKRKDFPEQVVHHIATIILICLSWSFNFVRIGSLLLVVLDSADGWLEAGKMANYTKQTKWANTIFIIFTTIWYITRLVIFPFWIFKSVLYDFPVVIGLTGEPLLYMVIKMLLVLLFILQLMWSVRIGQGVYTTVVSGAVNDHRSEEEPSSTSEDEITSKKTTRYETV